MPQPYLVPVRLSDSRRTQSSGISGGTSTCRCLPLTVNEIMAASWLRPGCRRQHDTQIALAFDDCFDAARVWHERVSEFFDSSRAAGGVGSSAHDPLHASSDLRAADPARRRRPRPRGRPLATNPARPRRLLRAAGPRIADELGRARGKRARKIEQLRAFVTIAE